MSDETDAFQRLASNKNWTLIRQNLVEQIHFLREQLVINENLLKRVDKIVHERENNQAKQN